MHHHIEEVGEHHIQETTFNDLDMVPTEPGYYEISLRDTGIKLKGIAVNLRKRLKQHKSSGGLKLKKGSEFDRNGKFASPSDAVSKSSVLAKHLYFDQNLKPALDFSERAVRQTFLLEECMIRFLVTNTKVEAREIEKVKENDFRYCGGVLRRT